MTQMMDEDDDTDAEEKSAHFKDAGMLRFVDGSVKVANEAEFINEFRRRANDSFWKTLECIQTAIKSKMGLGKHYFVPFKVELKDKTSVNCELKYNYKKFGKEYEKEV